MSRLISSGPSQRQLRVGEQVRHAVAQVLSRGEINDDVLTNTFVSITEVRMSNDLIKQVAILRSLDIRTSVIETTVLVRTSSLISPRDST